MTAESLPEPIGMSEEEMGSATVAELLAELQRQLVIIVKALEGAQEEMQAKVAAEREACAQIAREHHSNSDPYRFPEEIAAKIRARGEAPKPEPGI